MHALTKVTVGLVLLLAFSSTAAAQAATLRLEVRHQVLSPEEEQDTYRLVYAAAPRETNGVAVTLEARLDPGPVRGRVPVAFLVTDVTAPLVAGPGCAQVDARRARCPTVSMFGSSGGDEFSVHAALGDGNDGFAVLDTPGLRDPDVKAKGGLGADVLRGGDYSDSLDGGSGRDEIHGESGDDTLTGGDRSRDVLDGGPGSDDQLDYSDRRAAVSVDLARGRGGSGRERDRLAAIETVIGGRGDDTVLGDEGGNKFFDESEFSDEPGRAPSGDDRFHGRGGADRATSRSGHDRFAGGTGGDDLLCESRRRRPGCLISGGPGNDEISGGGGADRLSGGPGRDRVDGGDGGDLIFVRDRRRDSVNGGRGRDRAQADRGLDRLRSVESYF